MIYSKTQPAEVVQLLMEALKLSISEGEARQQPRGQAVLEEIDTDSAEDSASQGAKGASSATGGSGTGSQNGDQASSTSSPATTSYVDVEYPQSSTGSS